MGLLLIIEIKKEGLKKAHQPPIRSEAGANV